MRAVAYFIPDEAAEELDVTRRWVYHLLDTGRIDGHQKNGRHWRITPASVRRYKRRRDNPATRTTTGDRVLAAIPAISAAGHKATSRTIAQELETTPAAVSSALQFLKATGRVVMFGGRVDAHWLPAPDETGGEAMPAVG